MLDHISTLSFHAVLPALNSVRFFSLRASVSLQTNPVAEELLWKARKSQRWDTRRVSECHKKKAAFKRKDQESYWNQWFVATGDSNAPLCKISGDQPANEAMKQAQGSQCMKLLYG